MLHFLTQLPVRTLRHVITACSILFVTTGFAQQTLFTWGRNDAGQLGNGTLDFPFYPPGPGLYTLPQAMSCYDDWQAITLGDLSFQGIRQNGTLWTWGFGTQLGIVTETATAGYYSQPVAVQIGTDSDWAFTSTTSFHNLALKTDGSLWAWGDNSKGLVGDGTYTDVQFPKRIGADANWATVHAGQGGSYGIKKDGTLWGWGPNDRGAWAWGVQQPRYPRHGPSIPK